MIAKYLQSQFPFAQPIWRKRIRVFAIALLAMLLASCSSPTESEQTIIATATSAQELEEAQATQGASEPTIVVVTDAPTPSLKPSETPVPTETTEPTETPVPTSIPMLGGIAENDGYTLSAIALEDPATQPGLFYEPEEGLKLVAVELIVGNSSGEEFSSNVLNAILVDTLGFMYQAESGAVEGSIELLEVNTGERVQGWAGFIVPENTTPAYLKYDFPGASAGPLQVGLTP